MALVPWLATTRTAGERALGGVLVGLVCGLWIGRWIPQALEIAGSKRGASFLAPGLLALTSVAVPMGLVGFLSSFRLQSRGHLLMAGLVAGGVDWARGYVPLVQPWGLIGHSQIGNLGLAQLAVLGGVPLLSGLVFAANLALASVIRSGSSACRVRDLAAGLLLATLGLSLVGLPLASIAHRGSDEELALLVVQPGLSREARWARSAQRTTLRVVTEQTRAALRRAQAAPDLVVWPEMVVTTPLDDDPRLLADLLEVPATLGIPVVAGFARTLPGDPPGHYRNAVGWIDPQKGLVAVVDKAIAIPLIESSNRFPGSEFLADLTGASGWAPLRVTTVSGDGRLDGDVSLAVAICYEIQFPRLVAERQQPGTFAIFNPSSEGWIGSEALSRILLGFARLRAIEQRSYVIRSTDGGLSAVIDPLGRIVAEVPFGTRGEILATVRASAPASATEQLALLGAFMAWFGVGWSGSRLMGRVRR